MHNLIELLLGFIGLLALSDYILILLYADILGSSWYNKECSARRFLVHSSAQHLFERMLNWDSRVWMTAITFGLVVSPVILLAFGEIALRLLQGLHLRQPAGPTALA